MPPDPPASLSVRQHERVECDLAACLRIGEGDASAVRLSRRSPAVEGRFEVRLVDVSRGGLGVRSAVYLPPGCRVLVRTGGAGAGAGPELRARVRRAAMVDRGPTYYLGLALEGGAEAELAAAALLSAVGGERGRRGA